MRVTIDTVKKEIEVLEKVELSELNKLVDSLEGNGWSVIQSINYTNSYPYIPYTEKWIGNTMTTSDEPKTEDASTNS